LKKKAPLTKPSEPDENPVSKRSFPSGSEAMRAQEKQERAKRVFKDGKLWRVIRKNP